MKVIIDIPDYFEEKFKSDRFFDSLSRVSIDMQLGGNCFCRRYEIKLISMLREAFKEERCQIL